MPRRTAFGFACAAGFIPIKSLQCEWNACGEQAFQYQILEELEDDLSPLAITDLLQEKKRHWTAQLNALPL